MIKKIMVMASLSAVVCGGVYYFLYPDPKEQAVLTTKVTPAIESDVQDNIEEVQKIDYASIS